MALLLALLLAQAVPKPIVSDPMAADPYKDELGFQEDVERVLILLAAKETRDEGLLEAHDLLVNHPGSPILHYEKGCFYAETRKWDRAVTEWNEAVFADDGATVVTVRSLEGVAAAEFARGKKTAAVKALERITKIIPLSYKAQNRLAEAYKKINRSDKALRAWAQSYKLNPTQPDVRKRLGKKAPRRPRPVALPVLLKKLRPSIVLLKTKDGHFTGFIGWMKGWIVTCAHGLNKDTKEVEVIQFGKKTVTLKGRVIHRDDARDLALIHCPKLPRSAPVLQIVSAEGMEPGETVYTVGNPGDGKETLTLTPAQGILANPKRKMKDGIFIQCSMTVNPGNSGGPLLNRYGQVIGVVVRKSWLEGVCYSVPVSELGGAFDSPESLHRPPTIKAAPPKKK